ncbi:MAG TPA: AAA family ATPase [Solirubrobacteraceae bacterium]|nr:AAA family ATPase [Solirubrobacteraceae bacterium]
MLPGTEDHPHARAVLTAALPPRGRASHAYIFHGPAGSGKAGTARAFATALLGEGAADGGSVARRVQSGAHPDLTWVAPASAAGILVGDVDEPVVAAAARTPFEARRRVFVLEDADELNDQAANRMLKTLEEPAPFAHLILLTTRPGDVLPTIASRCQHVRFDAPLPETVAARLEGHGVTGVTALACARLGLGDARRALALAVGEGPELRAHAERYARAALHARLEEGPWNALIEYARAQAERAEAQAEAAAAADLDLVPRRERRRVEREAAERARRAARRARNAALDQALQLVGLWLRDVACAAHGAPELAHHVDRGEQLGADAAGGDPYALRAAVALVDETRAALRLYVNEELALEALAYRLVRGLGG